jgi:hypothetical protein
LFRPSTSLLVAGNEDVDARHKAGHDGGEVRRGYDGREAVRFDSSWPDLFRPSTSLLAGNEDVDARHKAGHNGGDVPTHRSSCPGMTGKGRAFQFVMAGLVPAIPSFVMAGLVAQVGFTRLVPHHLIRKSGRPDLRCHPRLWCCNAAKTWMPGIKPGMTGERFVAGMTAAAFEQRHS